MNDSTKIKWLAGTTVLLILINVSVVGFMWFGHHPPRPGMGGPIGPPGSERAQVIIHELGFNDAQRKQFEILRDEHQHVMKAVNEKDRHTHDALLTCSKAEMIPQQ